MNISDKEPIQQLVSLLISYSIDNVIVCPGSRNAPIVRTLSEISLVKCYPITDERSAAFVAIGMAEALCRPVAVCCTSGSALLDMAPAVAEAFYRGVPLLVISADRPKEWIGQMDGQTIDQIGSFGYLAKTFNISESDSTWYRNRVINDALMNLSFPLFRPVHINIQLSEPLYNFSKQTLPLERKIDFENNACFMLSDNALSEWTCAKRPLLIIGQLAYNEAKMVSAFVDSLLEKRRVVVLAEHLSNLQNENIIFNFDDILVQIDECQFELLQPDMVIYIGGHIVSKRLKQFIRQCKPNVCWHVALSDNVIDLFQSLTRRVYSSSSDFLKSLPIDEISYDTEYVTRWREFSISNKVEINNTFSACNIVGRFLQIMPKHSVLALANSSSVRYAQHFPMPQDTIVICNRGVNGIDGSLSSAVGFALQTKREVFVIIGDLSFFYDQNALWNTILPHNLHIVLLNDGGGAIFNTLEGLNSNDLGFSSITAKHSCKASDVATTYGLTYYRINRISDLEQIVQSESLYIAECELSK